MKIVDLGTVEKIKKGEHLLMQGQKCHDLFLISDGILRAYYLKDQIEITDWFATKDTTITALESFHSQIQSDQYIQAIMNSTILRIPKIKIENEIKYSIELYHEYFKLMTTHMLRVQERIKALQFYSAKERYDLLLEKNRSVVKYAKRSQIASYLGITLETLSRVTKS